VAVSVIIPALNEADRIGDTVLGAFLAGAAEVIVADGGSTDATIEIARSRGAHVVSGERVRARQLNRGARAARHNVLIFVHADTLLPFGAASAVEEAIANGAVFGGFRLQFLERGLRLQYVALMINLRTRLTRAPWGDQGQFVRRDVFPGFADFPIMEDYELARGMKRQGRSVVLPLHVRTSGRRFLQKGVIRTSMVNWLIIAAYHLGVSPERLHRWYYTR
jgi:rSAM/selenodomain-associated transferase 2